MKYERNVTLDSGISRLSVNLLFSFSKSIRCVWIRMNFKGFSLRVFLSCLADQWPRQRKKANSNYSSNPTCTLFLTNDTKLQKLFFFQSSNIHQSALLDLRSVLLKDFQVSIKSQNFKGLLTTLNPPHPSLHKQLNSNQLYGTLTIQFRPTCNRTCGFKSLL